MRLEDLWTGTRFWRRGAKTSKSEALEDASTWEREYEALLRRAPGPGPHGGYLAQAERRAHPRFRLPGPVGVQLEAQLPGVDISVEGLSFRSAMPIPVGQALKLVLARSFLAEVEVVACAREEDGSAGAAEDWPWRVHARFSRAVDGMRFIVMLDAMNQLDLAP